MRQHIKTSLLLFAVLFGSFFVSFGVVHAQNDGQQASADCIKRVTEEYSASSQECIAGVNDKYADDTSNPEYIVLLADCSQGRLYQEYQKELSACYEEQSLNKVWELPVLKDTLSAQYSDLSNITNEQSKEVGECIERLNNTYNLSGAISAEVQNEISNCFGSVGLESLANTYGKTAVVIDCAKESLEVNNVADIATLITNPTEKDYSYVEQCVIKKTAPVIAGLAVLNIPFASGIHTTILFGQFVLAQPLLLLRRRKYKTWGTVFNSITKNPLDLSSVRLIDSNTKKVIKSAVTGKNGNYLFLTPPGVYELEASKQSFSFPSVFGKDNPENYLGGSVDVKNKEVVIDKQVPLDPDEGKPSVGRFKLKKWQRRIGRTVGYIAPFLSALALLFVRSWWVWVLVAVHVVLLIIFLRLTRKDKRKKFGKIYTKDNKAISGAVVSLFKKPYEKRIAYTVTDMFGRYFLPVAVGDFTLVVEKDGLEKKSINKKFTEEDEKSGIVNIDVFLK